jgi:hypothetical protein
MITFKVDNVEVGEISKWLKPSSAKDGIGKLINPSYLSRTETPKKIHGMGANHENFIVYDVAPNFLTTALHSYAEHFPLIISPDDIWLTIAQGFSNHINVNAEALRKHFVAHEGQVNIEIIRDNFIMDNPDNDWLGTFPEFSDKIAEYIGKKRDLIVGQFSTTGPMERAAGEITLMDSMKNYFSYSVMTRCGIPNITLLGETKDWEDIVTRAENLREFDLGWWIDCLSPMLKEFVSASKGNINTNFWQNFVKEHGGSGGPYVSGHAIKLYPYLWTKKTLQRSDYLNQEPGNKNLRMNYLTSSMLPKGTSSVPFTWKYYGTSFPMNFMAGFMGLNQDIETKAIRTTIGWAVVE